MFIRIIALVFLSSLAMPGLSPPAFSQAGASEYEGRWAGQLDMGERSLGLVLNLSVSDGEFTASMDSPDQDTFGIPATAALTAEGIRIEVPAAAIVFTGTLSDADTMDTRFVQRDNDLPLILRREEHAPEREALSRPQTPEPPFSYISEEVSFAGGADHVQLAGTLTKPKGAGPFPAIVTITGSGPQDRDETIAEHKPFLVIADRLTRAGFVVLRYDDRGIASSTGDFGAASSADFAEDTLAAVDFLASRRDIDTDRITLLGHSEGGLIAPLAASQSEDISALILLAPPITTMAEIARVQTRLQGVSNGLSEAAIQAELNEVSQMTEVMQSAANFTEARVLAREMIDAAEIGEARREQALRNLDRRINAWSHFIFNYDPAVTLREIHVPILALFAEKDVSVEPVSNLALFKQVEAQMGTDNWLAREFSGLNHLFQTADTGAQSEYRDIEETMNPVVLDYIEAWIVLAQQAG